MCFPSGLIGHFLQYIIDTLLMFWLSSLGTSLKQNPEFFLTLTPTPDVSDYELYADDLLKKKTAIALPSKQKYGDDTTPKRCLYHVILVMPTSHELPSKWMKARKSSSEVKPPTSIKLKKPS